jgi:hypothetical protein
MRDRDGEKVVVLVDCANGLSHCQWILIPKEWNKDKLPQSGYLGMDEARYFYFKGDLPENVKNRFIQFFGLVTGKN